MFLDGGGKTSLGKRKRSRGVKGRGLLEGGRRRRQSIALTVFDGMRQRRVRLESCGKAVGIMDKNSFWYSEIRT